MTCSAAIAPCTSSVPTISSTWIAKMQLKKADTRNPQSSGTCRAIARLAYAPIASVTRSTQLSATCQYEKGRVM
jgi:hypothetical protein